MRESLVPNLLLAGLWAATLGVAGAETNQLRPWTDYRTVMWVGDSVWKQPDKVPLFLQRLRELGINTGMVYGDSDPQPFLDHQFPYYVENVINKGLCLKWNSKVIDWDKFVTTWTQTGRDEPAFVRDYSLDDPAWRAWARGEMQRVARKHAAHNPLAYDLRDELSTTISANPFDYDFHPLTLNQFRAWLKTQYPDLAALNTGWATQFQTWDEVRPFTTDQIKHRMASGDALPRGKPDWQALQRIHFDPAEARKQPMRWNLAPWCDFRTYMDLSLAGTLEDLRQAAHTADPRTPVGIEGTQMPSAFGGYDLWRLSQVLDWVEPYDIGNAREIFGSFMPGKTFVTTVFEKDTDHARRRLWHLLLEGDRGCIVWWSEDCIDWQSADYALTTKGKALAPVLREMTTPLAQLFLRAEKEYDPIALHYSQASIQVDWLLESTVDGSTWHRRFSSYEADHNRMAKVRNHWLKAFQDLGYTPRFVSRQQIESGSLRQQSYRVLALSDSLALSDTEVAALKDALAGSGGGRVLDRVMADEALGWFDAHGRLREQDVLPVLRQAAQAGRSNSSLAHPDPVAILPFSATVNYQPARLAPPARTQLRDAIESQLRDSSLHRSPTRVSVPAKSRTRIHRYGLPSGARLLAFERNIDYHMSEDLKQAGGNEALETPVALEARLAQPTHVYDLRAGKYLGQTDRIAFQLDPWQPSLFALLPERVAEERVVDILLARLAGK